MEKWIKELSSLVNDDSIIKFYIDMINEENLESYEQICDVIGDVSVIADIENNQQSDVHFNDLSDVVNSKVLNLNIKNLLVSLYACDGDDFIVSDSGKKYIKNQNDSGLTLEDKTPRFKHFGHLISKVKDNVVGNFIEIGIPSGADVNLVIDSSHVTSYGYENINQFLNVDVLNGIFVLFSSKVAELNFNCVKNSKVVIKMCEINAVKSDKDFSSNYAKFWFSSFNVFNLKDVESSKVDIKMCTINEAFLDGDNSYVRVIKSKIIKFTDIMRNSWTKQKS